MSEGTGTRGKNRYELAFRSPRLDSLLVCLQGEQFPVDLFGASILELWSCMNDVWTKGIVGRYLMYVTRGRIGCCVPYTYGLPAN